MPDQDLGPAVLHGIALIGETLDSHTPVLNAILTAVTAEAPSGSLEDVLRELLASNRQAIQGIGLVVNKLCGIEDALAKLSGHLIREGNSG